jgi:general secretion pathway protein D
VRLALPHNFFGTNQGDHPMQCVKMVSVLILSAAVLGGCAPGRTAFDKGQKFELSGNLDQAVLKYAEAAAANPEINEYRLRFLKASAESARQHLVKGDEFAKADNLKEALREYQTAYILDPSLDRAKQYSDEIGKLLNAQLMIKEGEELERNNNNRDALHAYQKALELNPNAGEAKAAVERLTKSVKLKVESFDLNLKSTKPITLKFKNAKLKDVFGIITKLSGINFIFDDAVKDNNFSIYLENGTFYQALDVITELNKLDTKILNESNVIVYPRTPDKKKQYQELFFQTFYLKKLDGKKAINLLRTMLQIKKIYVNEEMNAIVIRDTPEVIAVAGKILAANDIPDAEVVLDVEVIELSRKNAENLGFLLSRYSISSQGYNNGSPFADVLSATTTTTGTTTTAATPSNLLQLFQYKQFSGFLTVPSATFNFGKTLANGETLSNPKMRIKNKEKAKFNVGTRVPITTTSSPTGGGISVNVQYVDVGVKLNAEPTIQRNDDVTLKLGLEVSSILSRDTVGGSGSATTVVTIGTRNLDTVLSLKDGETSIIGGLIQDTKSRSKQKVSFIGDIPIIGSIFSSHDDSNDKTELILAITPHIVRSLAVPEQNVAAFWTGKEDEPSPFKDYISFNKEEEPPAAAAPAPAPAAPAGAAHGAGPATQPLPKSDQPIPMKPAGVPTQPLPAPQTMKGATPLVPKAAVPLPAAPASLPPAPAPATAAPRPAAPAAAAPAPAVAAPQPAVPPSPAEGKSDQRAVLTLMAPKAVDQGKDFQVTLTISDVKNMYNGVLIMQFDPAQVEFVSAAEGGFLKSDGKPTSFGTHLKSDKGRLTITINRVGAVGGVSGTGTLAVITLKGKAKGAATVGLSDAYIISPGSSKPMDTEKFNTVIEVR